MQLLVNVAKLGLPVQVKHADRLRFNQTDGHTKPGTTVTSFQAEN